MEDLLTHGVAVLPVMDEASRAWWEDLFWHAMDEFPEYRVKGRHVQRVLGGFGALGNPSSFHHPTVRAFRRKLKQMVIRPVMKNYTTHRFGEGHGVHLEALFDRICVRCEDFLRPTAELWHRDIYDAEQYNLRPLSRTLPGDTEDLMFGGWTNLDHRSQRFVALVGTHDDPVSGVGGFSTFSKEEIKKNRFDERLARQANQRFGSTLVTDEAGQIVVPPGSCVLFLQRLVHSVKGGPQPETPALRVFHGFRLTGETAPLFDHRAVIENGDVPRIPSGQIPPMYSKNHYAAFAGTDPKWREWAKRTFHPECLFRRRTGSYEYFTPGSANDRNPAVNKGRYMPSLAEMGLLDESYAYSAAEVAALNPQPL